MLSTSLKVDWLEYWDILFGLLKPRSLCRSRLLNEQFPSLEK